MMTKPSSTALTIRPAGEADLPAILAIYNAVIATTTAVYSEAPVTLEDRQGWLESKRRRGFPVIVAEADGRVAGFGAFDDFRAWPCYRHTVEHSVHVDAACRGRGVGRALVEALLAEAKARGLHRMIAGIDADNAVSIGLHRALGFTSAGVLTEVGRKFDRWLDLAFMQKALD